MRQTEAARDWQSRLALVALDAEGPGTLSDVAAVLAAATGSRGAVLWDPPGFGPRESEPSVLAVWLGDSTVGAWSRITSIDAVTARSFADRTLALPSRGAAQRDAVLYGLPVQAAFPVDHADGSRGALTLLSHDELADESFDVAADLLPVVPHVLTSLRERATLRLVDACNMVLHQADLESPEQPLPRDRLAAHLSSVCVQVAAALGCADVSIVLPEPGGAEASCAVLATSGTQKPGRGTSPPGDEASIEVPLAGGDHVWGLLTCRDLNDPPFHFTRSDLALLRPVAAQVARYWATWLHRRRVLVENDSWRRLAAGITGFNRLFADTLRGGASDGQCGQRVSAAALELVRDVVAESDRAVVTLSQPHGSRGPLVPVSRAGTEEGRPGDSRLAEEVQRTRTPQTVAAGAATEGLEPGWLVGTPISVGDRFYGALTGGGLGALPPHACQVYEIVGDQLGLYRHLELTLGELRAAQTTLSSSLRAQASAMEDLKHQLVSPLRTATDRTDLVLRSGRMDSRMEGQLRAVRGLCRKATRVAMSAGIFAALSKDVIPGARGELMGADDLLRMLIEAAADAQLLSDPRLKLRFDVDRGSVRNLRRRLVDVDASFLQQCVGNLLDNAAKYGYPGSRVRVAAEVSAGELALLVRSTGLPLAPSDAERCLERNWRGTRARAVTGEGSGIGLWIVDNLMRAMSGRVEVEPDGDTTTVRLVLPLA